MARARTVTEPFLREIVETFASLNVPYFVFGGVCLSLVRNNSLRGMWAPDNQDLDVGILEEFEPEQNRIEEALKAKGWRTIMSMGQLGSKKAGVKDWMLDIRYFSRFQSYRYFYVKSYKAYFMYDERLFENPEKISFKGMSVPIPNPHEEYLRQEYGDDWRVCKPMLWDQHQSVKRAIEFNLKAKLRSNARHIDSTSL